MSKEKEGLFRARRSPFKGGGGVLSDRVLQLSFRASVL